MRFELHFTPIAARDIEAALNYTLQNFGPVKYDQYKGLIREALSHLARADQRFGGQACAFADSHQLDEARDDAASARRNNS